MVDDVEGGLLKGDGQQDALVAGDAVLLAEQVNLPVDVRDVFRLSCDGKAVAAPVGLILQPEEGDVPTGPLFPEQRDRGGQQLHQQAPDGHGGDAAPMEPRNGRHAEQ